MSYFHSSGQPVNSQRVSIMVKAWSQMLGIEVINRIRPALFCKRHTPLFKVSRVQNLFMGVPKGPKGSPRSAPWNSPINLRRVLPS